MKNFKDKYLANNSNLLEKQSNKQDDLNKDEIANFIKVYQMKNRASTTKSSLK